MTPEFVNAMLPQVDLTEGTGEAAISVLVLRYRLNVSSSPQFWLSTSKEAPTLQLNLTPARFILPCTITAVS